MNENIIILLVLIAGIMLGIFFYGGLWMTVRKAKSSKSPALWFATSFLLRTGVVLTGFYYVAQNDWKRMLFCLGGFIISRFFVVRLTKTDKENKVLENYENQS